MPEGFIYLDVAQYREANYFEVYIQSRKTKNEIKTETEKVGREGLLLVRSSPFSGV